MDWQYRGVVAINDDTLYPWAFLNLHDKPVVLTIPGAGTTWSLLLLDVFGNRLDTSVITANEPGRYALIWKDWRGTPPPDATKVLVEYPVTILNIRADKYVDGDSRIGAAEEFRKTLRLDDRFTHLVDVDQFNFSAKAAADDLAQDDPRMLLVMMRKAVEDATTLPTLTKPDRTLADEFNA